MVEDKILITLQLQNLTMKDLNLVMLHFEKILYCNYGGLCEQHPL